jgi:signal transduction histidine kinase
LRRNGSACWIFSVLLVIGAAPGRAPGADRAAGAGRPAPWVLTAAEYLAGYHLSVPPPPTAPGTPIRLPMSLRVGPTPAAAHLRWIRCRLRLGRPVSRELGIYLSQVKPRAAVYLNGAYLGATAGFRRGDTNSWNYPLYVRAPAMLLRPGVNLLLIELAPHAAGGVKLGPIRVGRDADLLPMYRYRLWVHVTGVEVVTLLVGLIGALAAVLWLRRRSEELFGLFALSCGIWMVRNAQFFVVHTHSLFYFGLVTDAALFWLVAVLFRLSFRILERRFPRIEAGLFAYALIATAAMYLAGPGGQDTVTPIAYGGLLPIAAAFQVYLTWATLRSPTVLRLLLWLAATVTSLTGAYDLALMLEWVPSPASYLMPYSAIFYSATVGWALIDRFVKTHNEYEQLNVALDARIRERERALSAQYAKAAGLERERAVAAERDRILRNMHDGLGLHLIAARLLVEKGGHSPEEVSAVLGDAMDELRIAIDSMAPTARDLLVMLGNLRYRLEPRLNAAGISLHWDVADTDRIASLGPMEVTDITRIVQEACTNAIKHSYATDMHLSVSLPDAQTLIITITDNGRGYDTSASREGVGIASMHKRARNIGARLEIESRPGHTRTALILPTRAAADPVTPA